MTSLQNIRPNVKIKWMYQQTVNENHVLPYVHVNLLKLQPHIPPLQNRNVDIIYNVGL